MLVAVVPFVVAAAAYGFAVVVVDYSQTLLAVAETLLVVVVGLDSGVGLDSNVAMHAY